MRQHSSQTSPDETAPADQLAGDRAILPADDENDADLGRIGYGAYARYSPAILGLLIVAVVAFIGWREWRPDNDLPRPGQLVDKPAPDFTLPLFDGETIALGDFEGQAVALNFWASWCAPCKTEMPALQQVSEELRADGHAAVVIGAGLKNDYDQAARDLVEELGITYPTGRDTAGEDQLRGPIEIAYGVYSYPSTVFIRPDGTIFAVRIGEVDAEEIREYLLAALESPG